jgi:hypothetical protein
VIELEVTGFRDIDNHECMVSQGTGAAAQCFLAIENIQGETFTVFADGHPCAMFGSAPVTDVGWPAGHGVLWFLATPELFEITADFLGQLQNWLEYLQRFLPVCHNFVSQENTVALKWCAQAGFVLQEPVPYGKDNEPFIEVIRTVPTP